LTYPPFGRHYTLYIENYDRRDLKVINFLRTKKFESRFDFVVKSSTRDRLFRISNFVPTNPSKINRTNEKIGNVRIVEDFTTKQRRKPRELRSRMDFTTNSNPFSVSLSHYYADRYALDVRNFFVILTTTQRFVRARQRQTRTRYILWARCTIQSKSAMYGLFPYVCTFNVV